MQKAANTYRSVALQVAALGLTSCKHKGLYMAQYLLPLRFLMLVACLGALVGALLMFGLAAAKLGHGASMIWTAGFQQTAEITTAVMGATDALLFGVVLMIFAFALAFGFVFPADGAARQRIPSWMRVSGVGELKHTLVEVIIVYLVVDFATDLALIEGRVEIDQLIKPTAVLLIAAGLRLMGNGRGRALDE
ncbi:MAG: hypothetical protein JWM36_4640 [Hyphomicrobiales bacterium]|nr:hypothetical protein [Hyphomicrobiales bacterium]